MTYFNGKQGYTWLGESFPAVPSTRIVCDDCAHAGQVPFKPPTEFEKALGMTHGHQERPWSWAPSHSGWIPAGAVCDTCGKPQQEASP